MSGFSARVDRKELANALSLVAPAIPLRPQLPILAAVELRVVDGSLSIRATDYYKSIWRTIDAEVQSDGVALVSGHRLRNVVAAFTSAQVVLAVEGDRMIARSGRAVLDIATMNAAEFPTPTPLGPVTGVVLAESMADALARVQHASGGDEIESVIGIQISSDGRDLTVSATDRFALAIVETKYQGEPFTARLIYTEATAALKGASGALDLHHSGSHLAFANESGGMSAPLIDTPYPRLTSVIEQAGRGESLRVDREELVAALSRAGLSLVKDGTVVAVVEGGAMTISARDESSEITEDLDAIDPTGDVRFGVNPNYLASLLKCMSEPIVELALPLNGSGVMRITGLNGDDEGLDLHALATKRIDY